MIVLYTWIFPIYDKFGVKVGQEFVVSHGYDTDTGRSVVVECRHPREIGAYFHSVIGEWVLFDLDLGLEFKEASK